MVGEAQAPVSGIVVVTVIVVACWGKVSGWGCRDVYRAGEIRTVGVL